MRKLSNWIEAYMRYTTASEAPEKFHFWTAVSTIAGALRRRVWIDQGFFQWTPNFYIVFTAPPGIVSKSTTASIGMNLLREIPDIVFGPDAVTWQALTQSLAMSTQAPIDPETGLELPMSCITISSSEFGTFLNPQDREMVDVMVSLWDGQIGSWEKVTKSSGSDLIINPWINMIACTTPAWIAQNFPEYMIGGGFTSRTLFIYADQKRNLIAYPGQHVGPNFKSLREDLIHDLEAISMLIGEYKLSPEAIAWGEQWYAQHYQECLDTGLGEHKTAGYRARKQTHIHKLAIVLAAAKRDDLVIEQEDLQEAAALVTDLEKDMPKVFGLIGKSQQAKAAEEVVGLVTHYGVMDKHIIYRQLYHILSAKEIDEGIKTAMEAQLIHIKVVGKRILVLSDKAYQETFGPRPMLSPAADALRPEVAQRMDSSQDS